MPRPPFHLAFPVRELEATREFYGELLGCEIGRESERWIDFDFFGHQITAHVVPGAGESGGNDVDGDRVPVPHFGAILEWEEWHALAEALKEQGVAFEIGPRVRFQGEVGEQATMFFRDPSGNPIEFKSFRDPSRIFRERVKPRYLVTLGFLLAGCSHETPPSIVLVVADTLRADHLGVYGYERETSPELTTWSSKAAVFESAHASSPWTLPSMASLLTGEIPSRHLAGAVVSIDGEDEYLSLSPTTPTLAEDLAKRGYATAAFVTNPYLHPAFGLDRGFEHYDHAPAKNDSIRRAEVVVDLALEWIEGRGTEPVFVLVHLFEPHMDYDPGPEDRGRFRDDTASITGVHDLRDHAADVEPAERDRITAAYDEELLAVDRAMGRLLRELAGKGFLDHDAIFFTADHGEELFDRGGFEHGHSMHREVLGVPLLSWGRGVVPSRIVGPVSIADIAPTIREWVGFEAPTLGTSFLQALRGRGLEPRDVVAEMNLYGKQQKMLLRGDDKVICDPSGTYGQLFDMTADPSERTDLSGPERELFNTLAYDLVSLVRGETREREETSQVRIEMSTVEELEALGYLDGREE